MFMDLKGPFNLIKERKEDKHIFGSLIKIFESIINITRKVPSLVSLIAFIMFNNSFGAEKPYLVDIWMKYEK